MNKQIIGKKFYFAHLGKGRRVGRGTVSHRDLAEMLWTVAQDVHSAEDTLPVATGTSPPHCGYILA